MSLKKGLFLAIVLAGLMVWLYLFEFPRAQARLESQTFMPGTGAGQIKSLEITNKHGLIALKNRAPSAKSAAGTSEIDQAALKKWQFADIEGGDLDSAALNSLLTSILGFKLDAPLPQEEVDTNLEIYGLSSPAVGLKVFIEGQTREIALGKRNEYVGKRYAKVTGRPEIFLVEDSLFTSADKAGNDFRSKMPLEFIDADLQRIRLETSDGRINLETLEKGVWKIIEPLKTRAAAQNISSFTLALRNLRISDFFDGATVKLSDFGLDDPDLKITLDFRDPSKNPAIEIRLKHKTARPEKQSAENGDAKPAGSAPEGTFLLIGGKPSVFKLQGDPLNDLRKPADHFREKQLFKFVSDKAVQIDIDRNEGGPLSLIKSGEDWTVNGKPGDGAFIRQFLKELSELEAESFATENRDFGFQHPRMKAAVRFGKDADGKSSPDRLLVVGQSFEGSGREETRYFAGVDDLSEPFLITQASMKKISPREETLAKTQPTAEPAASPTAPPLPTVKTG